MWKNIKRDTKASASYFLLFFVYVCFVSDRPAPCQCCLPVSVCQYPVNTMQSMGAIWLTVHQPKSPFWVLPQEQQSSGGGHGEQNEAPRLSPVEGALKPLTLTQRREVWANQRERERDRVRESEWRPLSENPSTIVVWELGELILCIDEWMNRGEGLKHQHLPPSTTMLDLCMF